jgi:hypothetical protein
VDAHTFINKLEKFKQTLFARKLMSTVSWCRKGVLMVEFMQQVRSEVYFEALKSNA